MFHRLLRILLLLIFASVIIDVCCLSTHTQQKNPNILIKSQPTQPPNNPVPQPDGTVLVSTLDGNLHALDLKSGSYRWSWRPDSANPSLLHASPGNVKLHKVPSQTSSANQIDTAAATAAEEGSEDPAEFETTEEFFQFLKKQQINQEKRDEATDSSNNKGSTGSYSKDDNNSNNRVSKSANDPIVIPGIDGSLYYSSASGLERLPITVPELVATSPFRTLDNSRYFGAKTDRLFLVDRFTGRIYKAFSPQFDSTLQESLECDDERLIWIGRSDYVVNSIDGNTGKPRWNVSLGTYFSYFSPDRPSLTEFQLAELGLPLIGASVDGQVFCLDAYKSAVLWSHAFNSPIAGVHFVRDNNGALLASEHMLLSSTDMIKMPLFYFDAQNLGNHGAVQEEMITEALSTYYRVKNAMNSTLFVYVGQNSDGSLYALPNPTGQNRAALNGNFPNNSPSNLLQQNTAQLNVIVNGEARVEGADEERDFALIGSSTTQQGNLGPCGPGTANWPNCLTGHHAIQLSGSYSGGNQAIYSRNYFNRGFLPAPEQNPDSSSIYNYRQPLLDYQGPHNPSNFHNFNIPINLFTVILGAVMMVLLAAVGSVSGLLIWRRIKKFFAVLQQGNKKSKAKQKQKLHKNNKENEENKEEVNGLAASRQSSSNSGAASRTNNNKQGNGDNNSNPTVDNSEQGAEAGNSLNSRSNSSSSGTSTSMSAPISLNGIYTIGKMQLDSSKVLGTGSMGTVVFHGLFEGRACAIKRLVKPFFGHANADKEISLLIQSDQHENILRYYAKEEDSSFIYLALELCHCSLIDLVDQTAIHKTANRMLVLYNMLTGLAHLHELNIVHRDLKPANILLTRQYRCKLADMGLGKQLSLERSSYDTIGIAGSFGWQPAEVLESNRQLNTSQRLTKAVDVFSAGCIIFYILTNGSHPFGHSVEREMNILRAKIDLSALNFQPEGVDLVRCMIETNPAARITARDGCFHPLFWPEEAKLQFLTDFSDRVESEPECSELRLSLENAAEFVVGREWQSKLHQNLLDNLGKYRKYDFSSIRDLLRVIRNKKSHYRDLPQEVQQELGTLPSGFLNYFTSRFPTLLLYCYNVMALFVCHKVSGADDQPSIHLYSYSPLDDYDTSYNPSNLAPHNDDQPSLPDLSLALDQLPNVELNQQFRGYFEKISLRRLLQLQLAVRLKYRTWYNAADSWESNTYSNVILQANSLANASNSYNLHSNTNNKAIYRGHSAMSAGFEKLIQANQLIAQNSIRVNNSQASPSPSPSPHGSSPHSSVSRTNSNSNLANSLNHNNINNPRNNIK
jgi:serine/threonine-protein kinase/endoribonuclease IRE1